MDYLYIEIGAGGEVHHPTILRSVNLIYRPWARFNKVSAHGAENSNRSCLIAGFIVNVKLNFLVGNDVAFNEKNALLFFQIAYQTVNRKQKVVAKNSINMSIFLCILEYFVTIT